MQKELKNLVKLAKEELKGLGLHVEGLHYTIAEDQRKPEDGLWICFDAHTHNPNFFGEQYQNSLRIKLLDTLYEKFYPAAEEAASGMGFWLDANVYLKKPHKISDPVFSGPEINQDFVDVTKDSDVRFVTINDAIRDGELKEGSIMERYAKKYGFDRVLMHGRHLIAPDPISVDFLESVFDLKETKSVLEIGSGVGTSGAAAYRNGISDFTFVDISSKVCNWLETITPYKVVNQDAFDFPLDRHWDVISVGIPYELVPRYLEEKGTELSEKCDVTIIQSGCTAFFEFEHDWIMGKDKVKNWAWWNEKQTVPNYFSQVKETSLAYETAIIASNNPLTKIENKMKKRDFKPISYEYVSLS